MINNYRMVLTKNKIMQLLNNVEKPVNIAEIGQYTGDPYALIHHSLIQLVREGMIQIEIHNAHNVVRKITKRHFDLSNRNQNVMTVVADKK